MHNVFASCSTCRDVAELPAPHATVLALTAESAWACQQQGVAYVKLEDFYSEAELLERDSVALEELLDWMDWVDGFLQRAIPAFGAVGFCAAKSSFHLLHSLFDRFYAGAYMLERFLTAARPAEILYHPWAPSGSSNFGNGPVEAPIFEVLLPALAPAHGVSLRPVSCPRSGKADEAIPSGAGRARELCKAALGYQACSELRLAATAGVGKWLQSWQRLGRRDREVLAIGGGYDLDGLIVVLRRRGFRVRRLSPALARRRADEAISKILVADWPAVLAEPCFWQPFLQWGIGRSLYAERALAAWWHRAIPELWAGYEAARAAIERRRPSAAIAWDAGGAGSEGAMLAAARHHQVPCFVYQHGSTSRINASGNYHFLMNSDFLLAYGEGTAGRFRRHTDSSRHQRAQVVAVGSARLDWLRTRSTESRRAHQKIRAQLMGADPRPLVLYIPTHFGPEERALSDIAGYANAGYFELQQRVLGVFARFPNVRLIYKEFRVANGFANPVPDFIRRSVPNGISLVSPAVTKLIWAVDAIIVDHAVTALGEALVTDKPILVYDEEQTARLLEAAGAHALLGKRAVVAGTPAEFEAAVERFLAAGDFSPIRRPNREYLAEYGTGADDGRSAERAADLIGRVAMAGQGRPEKEPELCCNLSRS